MTLQATPDWANIKMVVFDVDGTLYNQKALRQRMMMKLLKYYVFRPWIARQLRIIQSFRDQREAHAGDHIPGLERMQYEWCAEALNIPSENIETVVTKWMHDIPLEVIADYRFVGLEEFVNELTSKNIQIAIYSDYPYEHKLRALSFRYDLGVSSTDSQIECLKPHPKGLQYLLDRTGYAAKECVFIGDRQERDGECARAAGMSYLNVDTGNPEFYKSLTTTFRERIN